MEIVYKEKELVEFIHPKYGMICMELVWESVGYIVYMNGVSTNIYAELEFYPTNKKSPFFFELQVTKYHSQIYRDYVETFLPESLV